MLEGRSILLIIGGGIAAYKTRRTHPPHQESRRQVRVILTKAGGEFVTPLTLASLSGEKVYDHLFSLTDEVEMGHIELSRSADLIVVAPATADLMAKAATWPANDLASTTLLATDKRVLMAPAMNAPASVQRCAAEPSLIPRSSPTTSTAAPLCRRESATLNGPLTFANAAAFNAVFQHSDHIPLVDNFTTVFDEHVTVITPGVYTFAVTDNDDGAAASDQAQRSCGVVVQLLRGIVGNNNTAVATRNLAAGTYTLVYAQREGSGGEAVTGRIQGPGFVGVTTGTLLPIVNPRRIDDSLNHLVKTGTGTATLSGNNTYCGVTLVQQGTLPSMPTTGSVGRWPRPAM